jgi:hypothetical protein
MYSSSLSLTSVLDGGGWSTPRPGRCTSGKDPVPIVYGRLGGPQGGSVRVRKASPPIFWVTYKNIGNPHSPSKRISEPLDGTKNVLNFFAAYLVLKSDKVRLFENKKKLYCFKQ